MKITPSILLNIILVTILTSSFFLVNTTANYKATSTGEYNPWIDTDDDGDIDIYDVVSMCNVYGTTGDPTKNVNVTNWPEWLAVGNVNVTNWPSKLLPCYDWYSGIIDLQPYPQGGSQVYYDFQIAGYRQVSVYIGPGDNLDYWQGVRIGMGDFTGCSIASYRWATYYNITTMTGFNAILRHTIDVRGPQLRIEVYNHQDFLVKIKVAIYATG